MDALGTIGCASGFTVADSSVAPYALCAVEGGAFTLQGCCAEVADAATDATYQCASILASRVSACSGSFEHVEGTVDTCTGTADEVAATCTGQATDTVTDCTANFGVGTTEAECTDGAGAGCTYTAAHVPLCADGFTAGDSSTCVSGCEIGRAHV